MITNGFFWHVHHNTLMEWSDDINERIKFIRTKKPKEEIKTRLKLLKPVKGKIPMILINAKRAYYKAENAYFKRYMAVDGAKTNSLRKARKAYDKAEDSYVKALRCKSVNSRIKALHKKECPDCPWNGKTRTIFPEKW